ncbi:two-component sensor histidine kinase [Cupriavidus sp. USMAA2-4]|nr:two-component sensor histidine kinase [Cupriavidus sp. USMAA2-4]
MMRSLSLTTRLALAFGLVAALVFGGAGTYLYRALATQVIERDDAELLRKAERVRREVAAQDGIDWQELRGVVSGNDEFGLLVRDAASTTLLRADAAGSGSGDGALPAVPPLAADAMLGAAAIRGWTDARGYPVRGVRALARDGHGRMLDYFLYQTGAARAQLMRAYRARLLLTGLVGSLAVAALGYLALRAAMAPLRRIAAGASDVTVRHLALPLDPARLPPELRELAAALQQMMDRLRDGFERLSQFSADLAHDFRTPIGNLLGQSQVALASERSVEEYQALLASNIEEYERLARMIENMLFLARAENARVALKPAVLDLERELAGLGDYFEGLAEAAGVALAVDGRGQVLADALLLRRAVGNLLANAIRFTPAGGTVTLRGYAERQGSAISVANPGPGIASEHLPRLFDRFFRADPARANSGESSGVGLAIVKSIMDLHGGSVEAVSPPGGMTVFTLHFPTQGEQGSASPGS